MLHGTLQQKVERMQASLHMIGAAQPKQHIVFVDNVKQAKKFDPAEHFDTAPELVDRAFNRPRKSQLEAGSLVVSTDPETAAKLAGRIDKKTATAYKYVSSNRHDLRNEFPLLLCLNLLCLVVFTCTYDSELAQRMQRKEKMLGMATKMEFDKQLMGKGHKRKLKGGEGEEGGASGGKAAQPVYRWKKQRRR